MSKGASVRLVVLGLVSCLFLAACAKTEAPYVEKSVNELYNQAMDLMKREEYRKAASTFDEVERQHPYSPWAARSLLMSAYANFLVRENTKSIGSLESFVQLHPGHENVAYAHYMIAMNHYDQINTVEHDQKATEQARKALDEVLRRHPNSIYARDARLKMALVRDHLAGKSVYVGRYYLKTGFVLAAIERFRFVVEKYSDTAAVEEALYRIVECYSILGMKDQVMAAASVLGENYPGSPWYQDAYNLVKKHYPDLLSLKIPSS